MTRPRLLRGLLTATATTAFVTLLTGPALAAPEPVPSAPATMAPSATAPAPPAAGKATASGSAAAPLTAQAAEALAVDDGLPTTEAQKVAAAREISIEADNIWLGQTDRNFVFKIWQNSTGFPLIRVAAELALSTDTKTVDAVCKQFILKGIFDAKLADDTKKIADEAAAREARDLKRAAYAAAGLTIDTDGRMLTLSERDAVIEIWEKATGPKVKAAAGAIINGEPAAQHEFLATGVKVAAEQDLQDAIAEAERVSKEEAARVAREGALKAAAAILGVVADAGKLAMADDDFIRWILRLVDTDEDRVEIRDAADAALRSTDRAVWRAFIDTGMSAADDRDAGRERAEREAAYRAQAVAIRTKAAADGNDNLVTAATQALARDVTFIADFNRVGQSQIAPDSANRPSGKPWQWSNVNSGKCLAAEGDDFTDGKLVVQANCADTDKQRWLATRVYNTTGTYRIINASDRNRCVSLADNTAANNIKFVIRFCDGGADQNFAYTKQGDNYVWASELTGRAITVQNASKVAGAPTLTYDVNNGANQQWTPTNNQLVTEAELSEAKVLNSMYGHTLRLQADGKVVAAKGGVVVWSTNIAGTRLVNQRDGNLVLYRADGSAAWASDTYGEGPSTLQIQKDGNVVLTRKSDNKVTWASDFWDSPLVSSLHGKCVTVPNASFVAGVQLVMQPCNGDPSQQFMFKEKFISFNNMCLHVAGGSSANSTPIQLQTCSTSAAQKWLYYSDNTFRNPQSGKCMTVPGNNRADGVKIDIYTCLAGATNQKW